jgi:hypothetical protein
MPLNTTWTNYSNPNVTGFYEAITYINGTTDGLFVGAMMIAAWLIFLLVFSKYGMPKSFMASSFIGFVLSGILAATGSISDMFVVFFGLATGISMLLLFLDK